LKKKRALTHAAEKLFTTNGLNTTRPTPQSQHHFKNKIFIIINTQVSGSCGSGILPRETRFKGFVLALTGVAGKTV
jgi:hypothetical protein